MSDELDQPRMARSVPGGVMVDPLEQMRQTAREKAAAGPKRRKKAWEPPDPSRFRHGLVLAFDQTLTNTGVALLRSDYGGLALEYAESVTVRSDLTSFEGTYDKADKMERGLAGLMSALAGLGVTGIVHEMPSVSGYRIESALIGGYLVRRLARTYARGVPMTAVSNRSMRTLLNAPDERDEKRYVRQAVESLIPEEGRTGEFIRNWNEHVHDAAALALTHLYQKDTP